MVFERFSSIAVGCGRRGIRSTCVQVQALTRGGIARFRNNFALLGDDMGASKISSSALFLNRAFRSGFGAIFGAFLRFMVVWHRFR